VEAPSTISPSNICGYSYRSIIFLLVAYPTVPTERDLLRMPNYVRNKFFPIVFGLVLLVGLSSAHASVIRATEMVCPIDGEKFEAYLSYSHTISGRYLDLKPYAAVAAPQPVAKCPTSGFLVWKETFSEEELASLRDFLKTDTWHKLKDRHTDYYLIAKLQEHVGYSLSNVRFTLLQATWEAKSKLQYRLYATEALNAYNTALTEQYTDPERRLTDQFVAGELERRLRKFGKAQIRFESLADDPDIQSSRFREILELQLKLINAKNSRPHKIP
jgi:hypothetical protein